MDNTEQTTVEETEEQQAGQQGQEKTFTQDDVNRIVQERLNRERAKKDVPQLSETEVALNQRESAVYLREQLLEHSLPSDLLEQLNGLDKETIDKCINIIVPYHEKSRVPTGTWGNRVSSGRSSKPTDNVRQAMGLE